MFLIYIEYLKEIIDKYEINLISCIFIFFTVVIAILGGLLNILEPHLPSALAQAFRYGKHSYKGKQNPIIQRLEVPKSWFSHFYVFAFAWSTLALSLTLKGFINSSSAPTFVIDFLDFIAGGKDRRVLVDSASGLLAIVLYTMQCVRRFYETNFVQIFSSHSKINLTHYLVGYLHYFGCVVAILANTEGFVRGSVPKPFSFTSITLMQYICCLLFHFSWSQQYKSNMILVNLRRSPTSGEKITEKHFMPKGGFFELVSSPHMLFEVAMYMAIFGIIPSCKTWSYVVAWVIINQTENAWLTHTWYRENFKDYPKSRSAIYPYIL